MIPMPDITRQCHAFRKTGNAAIPEAPGEIRCIAKAIDHFS